MRNLVAIVGLLVLAGCSQPPDFVDTNGVGHRYSDFDGRWRVINYWATWCAPCIHEIPELNDLGTDYAEKLVVLGVNFDGPVGEEAVKQVKRMKITFPVYAEDPAASLGVETPQVLPTTFIFKPDGSLHETLIGPQTGATILAAMGMAVPEEAAAEDTAAD